MITPGYVSMMARYNAWQNRQVADIVKVMDRGDLYHDYKAFFGSIMATLNHIHWGDRMWMGRLGTGVDAPASVPDDWGGYTSSPDHWMAERASLDDQILTWANDLAPEDLQASLTWRSSLMDKDFVHPFGMCITHMFNHQTHHRGQVHAMLTGLGLEAPVSDILFMPEDA